MFFVRKNLVIYLEVSVNKKKSSTLFLCFKYWCGVIERYKRICIEAKVPMIYCINWTRLLRNHGRNNRISLYSLDVSLKVDLISFLTEVVWINDWSLIVLVYIFLGQHKYSISIGNVYKGPKVIFRLLMQNKLSL